jgi:hypothetical protein
MYGVRSVTPSKSPPICAGLSTACTALTVVLGGTLIVSSLLSAPFCVSIYRRVLYIYPTCLCYLLLRS